MAVTDFPKLTSGDRLVIDALTQLPDGSLLFSTTHRATFPNDVGLKSKISSP
ncbi:MAG: hypothetical protein AAFU78_18095 [Cyanobacteria bacterium J06633_2]